MGRSKNSTFGMHHEPSPISAFLFQLASCFKFPQSRFSTKNKKKISKHNMVIIEIEEKITIIKVRAKTKLEGQRAILLECTMNHHLSIIPVLQVPHDECLFQFKIEFIFIISLCTYFYDFTICFRGQNRQLPFSPKMLLF